MFSVGDLVMCGDEPALILSFWCQAGMTEDETEMMAKCLWQNGDIEDVDVFCLEIISESR